MDFYPGPAKMFTCIVLVYFIIDSLADTAYAENSGVWHLFDDKYVKEVPVEVSVTYLITNQYWFY